ncbi:MAG: 3-oxocholest-4-en-26-oate---CoA ligase [Actinomycetota bacterium]|nr:3-oxocholest-4-en-26-oate---CoA ligase [Actinomycetota bacterium]
MTASQYNLADLFEANVDVIGEREAVVVGDHRLTYAQLDERSNRLAHHLRDNWGIKPGDHVGMHLYNGVEFVEGILACLKIRAVPINVNYRYVEDELRYIYENADLVGLLVNEEFADRAKAAGAPQTMVVDQEYENALAASRSTRDFAERSPDDRYIIYTGGTTGMPKGVVWRQEDLFFAGLGGGNPQGEPVASPGQVAENVVLRNQMVMFPSPPLMHGAAQLGILIAFNWGEKVVLVPRYSGEAALDLIEREKVNSINVVGDAMARPLAEALNANPHRWDLSSLFALSSAGAILSEAVKAQLREHLPNLMIMDGFGSTETGHSGMGTAEASPDKGLRFAMSDRIKVVDDDFKPIEPGSGKVGVIVQRRHIPLEYYKDPEKTAATFKEIDGERYVIAGDMATVEADGTVLVFGRGSVSINSGGEKIFPEEVEAALKSHPDVFDAVVVGVPDTKWGERVAAVVQPRPGKTPDIAELDAHCRSRVAAYKVPRLVALVDQMVRSPAGKADYQWARSVAAQSSQQGATD